MANYSEHISFLKRIITEKLNFQFGTEPGWHKDIDVEIEPWFGMGGAPRIVKIFGSDDPEDMVAGVTSLGTHWFNTVVKVEYDDGDISDLDCLNVETLASILDAVNKIEL